MTVPIYLIAAKRRLVSPSVDPVSTPSEIWVEVAKFLFFNDTATTEIYTLSLHDALPIYAGFELKQKVRQHLEKDGFQVNDLGRSEEHTSELQSHSFISYAVFCLKKK